MTPPWWAEALAVLAFLALALWFIYAEPKPYRPPTWMLPPL